MPDIVEELRTKLVADSGVMAAVAKRIYQDRLPQGMNTMPAVVLEEISGVDDQEIGGVVVAVKTRVRARCYANTPSAAASVRQLLRVFLAPYRGAMGSAFVCDIELAGKGNGIDPPVDGGDETWRPYKFQDFMFTHR